jgi:hypothetical protein
MFWGAPGSRLDIKDIEFIYWYSKIRSKNP